MGVKLTYTSRAIHCLCCPQREVLVLYQNAYQVQIILET